MREDLEKSFSVLAESPFWMAYTKRLDEKIKDAMTSLIVERDVNQICRLQGKIMAYRAVKDFPSFMFSKGTENNPDKE
jgi:hypothetical protein